MIHTVSQLLSDIENNKVVIDKSEDIHYRKAGEKVKPTYPRNLLSIHQYDELKSIVSNKTSNIPKKASNYLGQLTLCNNEKLYFITVSEMSNLSVLDGEFYKFNCVEDQDKWESRLINSEPFTDWVK